MFYFFLRGGSRVTEKVKDDRRLYTDILAFFFFLRETLLKIPSSILRLEDGTAVAWAFLGESSLLFDNQARMLFV